jgi:hypothetical protein
MKAKPILFLVILSSMSIYANAYGLSNLGFGGYPSHSCSRPYGKPIKPFENSTQWQIDAYNAEVGTFNFNYERYISCMKEYLETANRDIQLIRDKADKAAEEANSPIF